MPVSDVAEDFCAIQLILPDTHQFLEETDLSEPKVNQRERDDRRKCAEQRGHVWVLYYDGGLEPIRLRSLHADDKCDGQSPKNSGQAANQMAERTQESAVRRAGDRRIGRTWQGIGHAKIKNSKCGIGIKIRSRLARSSLVH